MPGSAAGLLVREGLEPGARYAGVVVEANGSVRFRHRVTTDGPTVGVLGPTLPLPVDLRIERDGENFVGWARAADAEPVEDWQEIGSVTLEGFASDAAAWGLAANTAAAACGLELAKSGGLRFQRGDCNDDGKVDISDAVCILGWLFLGGSEPACKAVTNANGDAASDISDATYWLHHLFLGGPTPTAPFPGRGPGTLPSDGEDGSAEPSSCRA